MKHVIVGSGVVGCATGEYLEAHGHDVVYNDINDDIINALLKKGKKCANYVPKNADLYWICTNEWHVLDAIETIPKKENIVIRSTIPPGYVKNFSKKYHIKNICHVPEFLTEANSIDDEFSSDRAIVGSYNVDFADKVASIFHGNGRIVHICSPEESSLIKLTANAWLSCQISFWNEMYELYDNFDVDKQFIADRVSDDDRISTYGTKMLYKPFGGACLPKDMNTMQRLFLWYGLDGKMCDFVLGVNNEL